MRNHEPVVGKRVIGFAKLKDLSLSNTFDILFTNSAFIIYAIDIHIFYTYYIAYKKDLYTDISF